jgi:hypothetical protein
MHEAETSTYLATLTDRCARRLHHTRDTRRFPWSRRSRRRPRARDLHACRVGRYRAAVLRSSKPRCRCSSRRPTPPLPDNTGHETDERWPSLLPWQRVTPSRAAARSH